MSRYTLLKPWWLTVDKVTSRYEAGAEVELSDALARHAHELGVIEIAGLAAPASVPAPRAPVRTAQRAPAAPRRSCCGW